MAAATRNHFDTFTARPLLILVLIVGNVLKPIDAGSVYVFLNGDVGQHGGFRGTVPVLDSRWRPHHVARLELLLHLPRFLNPTRAGRDDQRLASGMGVP